VEERKPRQGRSGGTEKEKEIERKRATLRIGPGLGRREQAVRK